MIGGVFLTLLSSASIFRSSVDLFLCLAKFLNVSSRMLAACGREGGLKEGGGEGGGGGEEEEDGRGRRSRKK